MDALTISLIALGAVAVAAFAVLAIREVSRSSGKNSSDPADPARVASGGLPPDREVAPHAAARSTPQSDAAADPADRAAPASDPGTRYRNLSGTQRLAFARLTVMPEGASFDRDAALSVAACSPDELNALLGSGLLEFDPEQERFALGDGARELVARELPVDEAHAARLRHAEYFAGLGAPAAGESAAEGAPPPALFEGERPHFDAAFAFLSEARGLERQLIQLVETGSRATGLNIRPTTAVRWLEAAVAAAQAIGDRETERDLLGSLGSSYNDAAQPAKAVELHERAAALCRELGDRLNEGRNLGNMGLAYLALGERRRAIECSETALAIMREIGDRHREGLALSSLGQAAAEDGDHARALDLYQQHLAIAMEANDRAGQILALSRIGSTHLALGDARKAADFFDQQLKLARGARDLPGEGNALGNLADAHRRLGQHDKAVECFERELEVAHLLGDARIGVRIMGQLGLSHLAADRSSRALECFDEQLRVARQIGDREGEAQALWYAAKVLHSRGQVADAITRASAALPVLDGVTTAEAEKIRTELNAWRAQLA